ncbi:MAG: PEGA domain-containing protein [Polyangia bacterium]
MPSRLQGRGATAARGRSLGVLRIVALMCLALSVGDAAAERRTRRAEKERAQAEALRAQGLEALGAKDLPRAEALLRDAYRLGPSPEVLYPLGLVAEARGDRVGAHDALRRFLAEEDGTATPEQRSRAEEILAQPRPQCGELSVLGARRALVRIDERPVGVLPLGAPLLLPAGSHKVVLESEEQRQAGAVEVPLGRLVELRFDAATGLAVSTVPPALLVFAQYLGSPPPEAQRLHAAVEQALRAEGHASLDLRTAAAPAPELAPCLGAPACQLQLAGRTGTEAVLSVAVTAAPPAAPTPPAAASSAVAGPVNPAPPATRSYRLVVTLLDTAVGELAAWVDRPCAACGPQQAAAALSQAVAELLRKGLLRPRGTLLVRTSPPGAQLVVDGRPVGRSPLQLPVWAGPHSIRAELPGHNPESAQVQAAEGLVTELALALAAPPPRKLWPLVVGGIAVGAGGLALTAGTFELLGLRGCTTTCATDTALGVTTFLLGAAATTTGVVLLVKHRRRPAPTGSPPVAAPVPVPAPLPAPPPR